MIIFKPETFGTKNSSSDEEENYNDQPPIIRNSLMGVNIVLIMFVLDHVQTERFRYAPKRNEAVLLVRIDVTATISQ